MGLMECGRSGCDHVCSEKYSDKHGYLCWQCFAELQERAKNAGLEGVGYGKLDKFISDFMESGKPDWEIKKAMDKAIADAINSVFR